MRGIRGYFTHPSSGWGGALLCHERDSLQEDHPARILFQSVFASGFLKTLTRQNATSWSESDPTGMQGSSTRFTHDPYTDSVQETVRRNVGIELRAESQAHLQQFVEVQLKMGNTFAALASTERILGNLQDFRKAKRDAAKAAAVVLEFLDRIDDLDYRCGATERCRQLERTIGGL